MAIFDGLSGLFADFFGYRPKLTEPDAARAADIARHGQPMTPDAAMRLATVWACVRLLAESIGTLPIGLYRRSASGARRSATDHTLYGLLHDSPNADQSAVEYWESVVACLCLWGNFYAEQKRNGAGQLIALNLLRPDLTSPYRDGSGARRYRTSDARASAPDLGEGDIFHVRGFGVGLDAGLSPVGYARSTLGAAMAADQASAAAFDNATQPSGFLIAPGKPTPEQKQGLRATFLDPMTGRGNAGRAGILEQGMDWKSVAGLPPEDLQLLETRAFHVEEICRWFRVPPFMVGHTEKTTSWGTGLEQQMIGFLTFSLRPYLSRIEQAIKKQLLTAADKGSGIYAEFSLEGLMRADSTGRAALYASAGQNGWMTRDEIRELENYPAQPGGDKLTVQSNLVPLDQLAERARAPSDTPPGFGLSAPHPAPDPGAPRPAA